VRNGTGGFVRFKTLQAGRRESRADSDYTRRWELPVSMKSFLAGVILVLVLVPLVGWLYLSSGRVPVATASAPFPFEKRITGMALRAVIQLEAPKTVPLTATPENLMGGAEVYKQNCAVCHGLPLQAKTAIAAGMFPPPPQLWQANDMVTDDPAGVTYWKVANGIRLTGMPGFKKTLSETQMWQVSLLLANADKLPPATQQALVAHG